MSVPTESRLPVYDSLDAAQAAETQVPRFLTRGRTTAGDGGHGCYQMAGADEELPYVSVSAYAPINQGDPTVYFSLDA